MWGREAQVRGLRLFRTLQCIQCIDLKRQMSWPTVTLHQVPGQVKAAASQASVLKAARFPGAVFFSSRESSLSRFYDILLWGTRGD